MIGLNHFNLGALLANLILAWVSHFERSKNDSYQNWLLDMALNFYKKFETKFLMLWNQHQQDSGLITQGFCDAELLKAYQKQYLLDILQDSVGFAGLKMARRILGIAGVADIRDIKDQAARARAEIFALNIAQQLVTKRKLIHSIEDILPILQQERQHYEQSRIHKAEHYSVS